MYQKLSPTLEASNSQKAKNISTKKQISNRVERLARAPTLVTLKDQKEKFCSKLAETINGNIIDKLQFNQWRNTDAVLKRFNNITDKSNCSFIQFYIKEFYPSIT